ncbi:zf-HC2 domain-containing protein [Saccharopolyspora shandongensis]|uniref:zf-HC2 domain-containing protein n=1 Tax=Saccharopolyspora shandongensis TaxID=418495 RepID=UPI00342981CC
MRVRDHDGDHLAAELVRRYTGDDPALTVDETWAVEAHLESCAACRGQLASNLSGDVTALLEGVWAELEPAVAACAPQPTGTRWLRHLHAWASPVMLPWFGMTALVLLLALAVDAWTPLLREGYPSMVLLLAPVAPLLCVAAAWSRGLDPAHEVLAGAARGGAELVLRRTAAVLVVVIPMLLVVGWVAGTSPARWLLPCLAFTAGSLALGSFVGVTRAAVGLIALWAGAVVLPSLFAAGSLLPLEPSAAPLWGAALAVGGLVLAVRSRACTRLDSP